MKKGEGKCTAYWRHPDEKRHKTVNVVCFNCFKASCVTLFGLANEYRGMIATRKCMHCGAIGKLVTNGLAKPRVKVSNTNQLKLNLEIQRGEKGRK